MLAQFGFGVLTITFLLALFSAGAAIYGYFLKSDRWVESSRRALRLTFLLISLSALTLIYLLVTRAVLSVFKDGKLLGEVYPRYDLYPDGQPVTVPGIRSSLSNDLYVVLVNWENVSVDQTPFKVDYNPLVNWLWIGSVILLLGTLVAAWPEKEEIGNE